MEFANRIGTYLILLGVVLVLLFIFSDIAGTPSFGYFFIGVLCAVGGAVLWWRTLGPRPSEPPARFRMFRKMTKKDKKPK
ncbi:MAG TPA: hypothetical protein PJ988_21795 [Anaerolinea sp.]|nr:hypothetical protein [Anaerolinea sp.]